MKEPRPGRHGADRRPFQDDVAAAVQADEGVELHPHRLVEGNADAPQDLKQLRVGAEPGPAARQILGVALEHERVPADAAHEIGGQQPAERAADHQRAWLSHYKSLVVAHAIAQDMLSWPGL